MAEVSAGVVNVLLFCPAMGVPFEATLYQTYWPFVPPDAESTRVLPAQPVTPGAVGAEGNALTTNETVSE